MVSLRQDNGEDNCSSTKNGFVNPREIREVIAIQRNPSGQIYKVPDLNKSLHFSANLPLIEEIHHRLQFLGGNLDIPLTVVPNTKIVHNSNGVFVRNGTCDSLIDPLSKCKQLLQKSISQHQLLDNMKLIKDGANRKSPCLSFGWTKTNANAYKTTRTNLFQNTLPSVILRDFETLSTPARATLVLAVQEALLSVPELNNAFNIPDHDADRSDLSRKFSGMWLESVRDYLEQTDYEFQNFSFEAFTVMVPIVLGPHRDKLNDFLRQMSNIYKGVFRCELYFMFDQYIIYFLYTS